MDLDVKSTAVTSKKANLVKQKEQNNLKLEELKKEKADGQKTYDSLASSDEPDVEEKQKVMKEQLADYDKQMNDLNEELKKTDEEISKAEEKEKQEKQEASTKKTIAGDSLKVDSNGNATAEIYAGEVNVDNKSGLYTEAHIGSELSNYKGELTPSGKISVGGGYNYDEQGTYGKAAINGKIGANLSLDAYGEYGIRDKKGNAAALFGDVGAGKSTDDQIIASVGIKNDITIIDDKSQRASLNLSAELDEIGKKGVNPKPKFSIGISAKIK